MSCKCCRGAWHDRDLSHVRGHESDGQILYRKPHYLRGSRGPQGAGAARLAILERWLLLSSVHVEAMHVSSLSPGFPGLCCKEHGLSGQQCSYLLL